jgi:GntR family transcriptional regulator
MAQQLHMYVQIAEDLRKQIELGALTPNSTDPAVLTPGEQLPTELELRERYEASRNTVRDAIKRLTSLGLVESRPGRRGTFVTRKIKPFVTVLSIEPNTGEGGGEEGATYPAMVREQGRSVGAGADADIRVLACPPEIAGRLQVKETDKVVSRHQQRLIDDTIWSLQTSYYPLDWVNRGATRLLLPENIEEGTVQYLSDTLGLKRVGYRDWVTSRAPNDVEQSIFGLLPDATLFEILRASFAQDGTPMLVMVTVYPADRNHIVYEYGTVPKLWFDSDLQ